MLILRLLHRDSTKNIILLQMYKYYKGKTSFLSLVSECVVSRLSEQCDNGEAEILLVESEQASCSEGSSEEYLKESADMEDSVDEAEEGSRGVYSSPKLSFL